MLRSLSICSFSLIAVLIASPTWAQVENTPQGQKEALGGNIGHARNNSLGGFIYNPASTADFRESQVSTSGSTLSLTQLKFSPGQFRDETSQPTLNQEASLSGALYHWDQINAGIYLNKDSAISIYKYLTLSQTNFKNMLEIQYQVSTTQLGFLISTNVDESLALGATLAYVQSASTSTQMYKTQYVTIQSSSFSNMQSKVNYLKPKLGILWHNSFYQFGVTASPKGYLLYKNANTFAFTANTDGTTSDNSTSQDPNVELPESYALGIQLDLNPKTKMELDVINDKKIKISDDDTEGSHLKTGISIDRNLSSHLDWISGLSRTWIKSNPRSTHTYISTGLSFRQKQINTLVGFFYSEYITESKSADEISGNQLTTTGLSYAATYYF